jgi:hypothetical protein
VKGNPSPSPRVYFGAKVLILMSLPQRWASSKRVVLKYVMQAKARGWV